MSALGVTSRASRPDSFWPQKPGRRTWARADARKQHSSGLLSRYSRKAGTPYAVGRKES